MFLHKFLLKTKIKNSLLVTVIAQFTAKTTNSEKAIYFLPLTSSSINKLKSHLLFTCKNFMLSNFMWKKIFAPGNSGGSWRTSPCPSFSTVLKSPIYWLRYCLRHIRQHWNVVICRKCFAIVKIPNNFFLISFTLLYRFYYFLFFSIGVLCEYSYLVVPRKTWKLCMMRICSKFTGEPPSRSWKSNFVEIVFWHWGSPENLLHIFRTPFLKNTSGRLLLYFIEKSIHYERIVQSFTKQQFLKPLFFRSSSERLLYVPP